MPRYVEIYEDTGTTLITTLSDFVVSTPGTPSAAQEIQLWNDKGGTNGASDEINLKLRIMAKQTTDASFSYDNDASNGFLEYRVVSGLNITVSDTGWQKAMPGSPLMIPELESDQGVVIQIRANPPSYVGAASFSVKAVLSDDRSTDFGSLKANLRGISSQIGDQSKTEIFYASGNVVEDSGGPSNDVETPDFKWTILGVPYHLIADPAFTIGTTDVAAATPGVGESFIVLLTLGAGTLNITKGAKGVTPSTPTAPAGEILVATVTVDDTGNIEDADILNAFYINGFNLIDAGLNAIIGGGTINVNSRVVDVNGYSTIPLNASDDNYIAINGSGSLQVFGNIDELSANVELLHYAETDGSGVIAELDLRKNVENSVEIITLDFMAPVVNDYSYGHYRQNRRGYVKEICVSAFPTSGTTSGSTKVDIEYLDDTLTWVSLFTSSGTDDRRPSIAYTAAYPLTKESFPEVVIVPGKTNIRAKVIALPGGGTIDQIRVTIELEII